MNLPEGTTNSGNRPIPDFEWYSAQSRQLGLSALRCPFASLHGCPKYYESRSLLGRAGSTELAVELEQELEAKWKAHPLAPKEAEQAPTILSDGTRTIGFANFCPEVLFDRFRLFASFLHRYVDEIDVSFAHKRLTEESAGPDDPAWSWSTFQSQHFSECSVYSPLAHGWSAGMIPTPTFKAGQSPEVGARYDVFISHASEDKDAFVRPLAGTLTAMGLRVWFDEWTLKLGDGLRDKIDRGLLLSDFGVVVLSKSFFAKHWTQAELEGLFAKEMDGRKVILPVWHDVSKVDVMGYSPMLAGKLGASTREGVESVARRIIEVVRPGSLTLASSAISTVQPRLSVGLFTKGSYQRTLGKRHRHLRETVLRINPRQMADFYGFEKVAQLEACERGDDELPTGAVAKLREFFFVRREYLEEGAAEIFGSFNVISSAEECGQLLSQGFEPYLLCQDVDRENLWCYPVLHKEDSGFDRILRANTHGYFASRGGGKNNILNLIRAMKANGLCRYDVTIMKVNRNVWDELQEGRYYRPGMGGLLGPDHQAQDCFFEWWSEHDERVRAGREGNASV